MTGASNDPVVRYTAGLVILAAFLACLAIAVHGYWTSAAYVLPPFISTILSAGIGGALTLLGIHAGAGGATAAVQAATEATRPPPPAGK